MKRIVFFILIIMSAGFSCGAPDKTGYAEQEPKDNISSFSETAPAAPQAGETDDRLLENMPQTRYRIKTAAMRLEVSDFSKAEKAIQASVQSNNGYISASQLNESRGNFTCKIPADNFDAFLTRLESLGNVREKQISEEDVTNQFFDLETRIKNKRILMERYQSYLAKAQTTRELIELERTINNVTTEIESLEGSMKHLSNQITFSTLSLSIELPPGEGAVFSMPSFIAGLRGAGEFLLIFLYYILMAILYILIVSIPILLIAGGIYFAGFGRLGLIIKFFRVLGPKKM